MMRELMLAMAVLMMPAVGWAAGSQGDSLKRWGSSLRIGPGRVIVVDKYQKKWQKGKDNFSIDFSLSNTKLPSDSDDYASLYGFPSISGGVKVSFNHKVTMHRSKDPDWGLAEEVDYDSSMGNTVVGYASFERPFFRNKTWGAGYAMAVGLGYSRRKYNPDFAVDNELIGSRWLVYFGAGLYLTYRVAEDWGLRTGLEYWHLSNGALNRPNKGANFLGPTLGVSYFPYYKHAERQKQKRLLRHFDKYFYANLAVGIGAKTLNEEWLRTQFNTPKGDKDYRTDQFRLYWACSVQADLMYRYHLKWASGVGLDIFYGSYASRVRQIDEQQHVDVMHSPWSVGLAVKHKAFYHRMALTLAVGYYLYREMGHNAALIEKPYYEKIGLQYTLPIGCPLTVGMSVKAHLTKADLVELVLSMPLVLAKKD